MSRAVRRTSFDIVVMGAGYVGSLAALLLARKGYSVALIERGAHPRFSLGESTTPEQNRVHLALAQEFHVPELVSLSSYTKMKRQRVPVAVWPKEAFYFLLNEQDSPGPEPREVVIQTGPWPLGPDYHCMRGDYDLHLLTLAVRYGACYFGMAEVTSIELRRGVSCQLKTSAGAFELHARFLVDASGPNSVVARTCGIGISDPDETCLRSRAVFSHFVNVDRLEHQYPDWRWVGIPRDHATVHCAWDGGWAWIIPFENGVTSVGVVLDVAHDRLDHTVLSPEQAFWSTVGGNRHLTGLLDRADSIREYTRTGPIQYRVQHCLGEEWFMLPPASGLADALLSPGNAVAANGVARLVTSIDLVLRDGLPAREVLAFMERRFFLEYEYIRKLQHIFFESFHSVEVFRETSTLFLLAVRLGLATRPDPGPAAAFQPVWGFGNQGLRQLTDEVYRVVIDGRRAQLPSRELAAEVRHTLQSRDPTKFRQYFLAREGNPSVHFNRIIPLLRWSRALSRSGEPALVSASHGAVKRLLSHARSAVGPTAPPASFVTHILRQVWIQLVGKAGHGLGRSTSAALHAARDEDHPTILFDGLCTFCVGAVGFIIKRDPRKHFRFAPVQSTAGALLLRRHDLRFEDLRSFVLIDRGAAYQRSTAALRVAAQLSLPWPLLTILRIVPRAIRDRSYALFSLRKYAFGRRTCCMLPRQEETDRFLA